MQSVDVLSKELKKSAIWTLLLTLLFILFYRPANALTEMVIALPFFIVFYYCFFTIGKDSVSAWLRNRINGDIKKIIIFPAILLVLYFSYVLINGQNPYHGTLALVPYLIFFPVLLFAARRHKVEKIDWLDFTAFVIYLLPTTLIEVNPAGDLPFKGESFDSIYRIILILSAVYAFGSVRGLKDIGFFPVFKWKFLWTSVWVWFAFYLFVLIIGFNVNFIRYVGHDVIDQALLHKIFLTLIAT